MVNHERLYDCAVLPVRQVRRSIIHRFIIAVFSLKAGICQLFKIDTGLFGGDRQGQHRSIRGDHQIIRQVAFQTQSRNTESFVLIVFQGVDRVVPAFGNAPRHPPLFPVCDLNFDRGFTGVGDQGVFITRHDQERHQILEHGTAPREENRFPLHDGQQTAEGKPALLRQLPLRDGGERGES